jgi:hypothetical protein
LKGEPNEMDVLMVSLLKVRASLKALKGRVNAVRRLLVSCGPRIVMCGSGRHTDQKVTITPWSSDAL